jgi:hypothetical protein
MFMGGCTAGGPGKPARMITETTGTNYDEQGLPGWVNRGSTAIVGETGRTFYGVGMAGNIRNPSLLRTTADNRARNELAKVFETFSASLMRDYMASGDVQEVSQATKTVTSKSLKGSEIVDRYIDRDGTIYALAQLDLARVEGVIKDAYASGAVKSGGDVDMGDLEKVFDGMGRREVAAGLGPAVAGGGAGGSTARGAASGSSPKERSGDKPDWVDGKSSDYPAVTHLCGVGFGPDRSLAESGAHAALSRIFVARVQSASLDFMGAYSATGSVPLETQSSEALTQITTEKLFSGVFVPEVWNSESGEVYALACLIRAKAARVLREQISALDAKAGRYLDEAAKSDKASRVGKLSKALDALVEREAFNAELRIISVTGIGQPGRYSHADVVAAFEAALEDLRVAVKVEGAHAEEFRSGLVEALKGRGYTVLAMGAEGVDVQLSATVKTEDGGKGSGQAASIHFARAIIEVEVLNVVKQTVLGSFVETRKDGSRNLVEAQRLAVRRLVKKITQKVSPKIDSAMTGR